MHTFIFLGKCLVMPSMTASFATGKIVVKYAHYIHFNDINVVKHAQYIISHPTTGTSEWTCSLMNKILI